jgi:hypothetical protein
MDQVNSCREYAGDDAEDDGQDRYDDAAERCGSGWQQTSKVMIN